MYEIVKTKKGYDITLTRGDSLPLQLTLKKNNESYTPGSEAYIRFAMKTRYNDDTPVLVKEIPVDTLQLIFIPEDTKDILNRKSIVYGCYSLRIGNSGEDFGIVIQDKHNGHIMLDKLLKFNFCPMCGKSLKDIEGRTVKE